MKPFVEGGGGSLTRLPSPEMHKPPASGPVVCRLDTRTSPGPFDELGDPLMR